MNYKYIEQLLDKYFRCETSLEEEQILRAFFSQETVPVQLLPYRQLFTERERCHEEDTLSADFDQRIMSIITQQEEPKHVKAIKISWQQRLRPLYKAAASVAIVLAIGQAAQMPYIKERQAQDEQMANIINRPNIQKGENSVAKTDSTANTIKTEAVPAVSNGVTN